MKVLQVNTTINSGSTGRIAEGIGEVIRKSGGDSYIAGSVGSSVSSQSKIVGNKLDKTTHILRSLFLDQHGLGSQNSTKEFVKYIEQVQPDIIHLHNVHGYYLNIQILFNFLKTYNRPLVWTFHDCWPFTGHCAYFDRVNCNKWITGCNRCPLIHKYPASFFYDRSEKNYMLKKQLFQGVNNLTVVTPSKWLKNFVEQSFFKENKVIVIPNGIDTVQFSPKEELHDSLVKKYRLPSKRIVLGVANVWDDRKGLNDFIELSALIDLTYVIVLVGLNDKQIKSLPHNIIGIKRTESISELAGLYSIADVFINPTKIDNFPTTNLEAMSCGTPVITYDTGGCKEAINAETGYVIQKGNIDQLLESIHKISDVGKKAYSENCISHIHSNYNKHDRFRDYFHLYESLT
ncbi:glycosyltransferase [Flavihumibacter sp. RY-1]|uniref:Glycosyltransferase n=1 Tax=Flavihumibacter fluminis TaxID=2909236 RepID=A0ABS9BM35_9BACT|nr:glycosyltransferase [Flavihumibacter fluminis]MCF1716380.1 glycosyltransferase [Flavihumibacter fluminis]